MKFSNLFLTKKIYNLIRSAREYIHDKNIVQESLYNHAFITILEKYLNTKIKKDWIGRLYGVVNPDLDELGNFDLSRIVIEFGNETTHNAEFVKTYIYKQLNMISELFKLHRLYDYLACDIEHVGPDTEDNYLVVISIVSQNLFINDLKKVLKQTILYLVILLTVLIFI